MDHALSCVLQTADGEGESAEGAAAGGARGARIEAHKAFAAAAEQLAVVEGEVRLVHEQDDERIMVEADDKTFAQECAQRVADALSVTA